MDHLESSAMQFPTRDSSKWDKLDKNLSVAKTDFEKKEKAAYLFFAAAFDNNG